MMEIVHFAVIGLIAGNFLSETRPSFLLFKMCIPIFQIFRFLIFRKAYGLLITSEIGLPALRRYFICFHKPHGFESFCRCIGFFHRFVSCQISFIVMWLTIGAFFSPSQNFFLDINFNQFHLSFLPGCLCDCWRWFIFRLFSHFTHKSLD